MSIKCVTIRPPPCAPRALGLGLLLHLREIKTYKNYLALRSMWTWSGIHVVSWHKMQQGSPVSSKAEKKRNIFYVFFPPAWKKQLFPVSSAKIQKKLISKVKSCFLCLFIYSFLFFLTFMIQRHKIILYYINFVSFRMC